MEFEVEFGAYKQLNDAQKIKLLNLAAEKDYVNTLIESYKEYDDIIEQGNELASRQREAMAADYQRLTQMFSGENQSMYSQFDDAFKAKGLGIIDDQQLARSLENISQGFDVVTGKAQESTDQMSEFAVQAARNMQTAFADFLFDPFEQGADGMLESFTNVIRRMAAEAASAQIMDTLFGKAGSGGNRDFSGGWLGAAFDGIASYFHDGGVVGSGGSTVSVPMGVFAGAPRLHSGGYLKPDEVPAILQTGEMVLSRKQVAAMGSGGMGDVQVNTTVNVSGNSSNTDNMQKLGNLINARVREVITTEKRPGGLLA
jgi:hypothetical protein